jgi:hypothetical protein
VYSLQVFLGALTVFKERLHNEQTMSMTECVTVANLILKVLVSHAMAATKNILLLTSLRRVGWDDRHEELPVAVASRRLVDDSPDKRRLQGILALDVLPRRAMQSQGTMDSLD